jgi:D-alanyl-D-alanine carboxypeptidase
MDSSLGEIHEALGITSTFLSTYRLPPCAQPPLRELEVVAIDFEGKPFVLTSRATIAWKSMCESAGAAGVTLVPFSGFRSYEYQKRLIERHRSAGRSLDDILSGTAVPGFSEHHSGCAVDICTTDKFGVDEQFDQTAAFAWLNENAVRFKFTLSYPRNNPYGIIYEPWHWFYRGN